MGGQFEPAWIEVMREAASLGYDIVSGMHARLESVDGLAELAARGGGRLVNVRIPPTGIKVANGLRPLDAVQAVRERGFSARLPHEPGREGPCLRAHAIQLRPVAGRDDDGLGDAGKRRERCEREREPLGVEHDALAHLDRCGAVVQPEDEEGHDGIRAENRRIVR